MEMNGSSQSLASASQPSASASGSASAPLQPAPSPATTPQQVAAAAAALAASRAASVSAAMRSVFGAKQQAALASAMMNASVNAAASKAAAAAAASASASASASATATARPTALTVQKPTPTSVASTSARAAAVHSNVNVAGAGVATTSVVVMQSSLDGLPALASHTASCALDDTTARIAALACGAHDVPLDGAVALYGAPATRASVRAVLVDHYAATNQLVAAPATKNATPSTTPSSRQPDTGAACVISEMTLRMDTELEMLRRQCFAERNARWQFLTPDAFVPAPTLASRVPAWVAAPYVGPRCQTLLLRKHHEHQRLHATSDRPSDPAVMTDHDAALLQSLVGVELTRDRAWPPKEFMAKSNTKPSRGGMGAYATNHANNRTSSGKKKPVGMAGVVDDVPVTARVCSECRTQSSALWRKRPRAISAELVAVLPAEGAVPPVHNEEDVCLPCYLKTQRRDLFERKAVEKVRRMKEEAARAAAEARALKKQQQQMQKKIKKLQQQQLHGHVEDADLLDVKMEVSSTHTLVKDEDDGASAQRTIKLTRRESMTGTLPLSSIVTPPASSSVEVASHALSRRHDHHQYDDDVETATDDKKKREKKSKKDKKKKKKKKKKKASSDGGGWDDSDSDDDGAASSVIMPSPPQRQMDGFVYADRDDPQPLRSVDDDAHSMSSETRTVIEPVTEIKSEPKSKKRAAATTSRSASSKKRKSSDAAVEIPIVAPTEKARSSRARTASASAATAPAAAPTAASPAAATTRKRARPTKKETARERELRALGQYCPVCNMTYEEDDASPFVCCDSCEMWVHVACDASLSADALATLADSNEKYVCPLCSGR